jgi:hypothetical protein
MDMKRFLSALFWFLVNCLAFSTATLPFLAIERSMVDWGPPGYALLIAAAAAFVSMWLLITAAVLLERAGSPRLKRTRGSPRDERKGQLTPSA